jgi:hypothetical protein
MLKGEKGKRINIKQAKVEEACACEMQILMKKKKGSSRNRVLI